jgi:hypothetical protein
MVARRILVSGSQEFPDQSLVDRTLRRLIRPDDLLMHGCARGVDTWAGLIAEDCGATVLRRPADWNRYGRQAGALRNRQMLEEARRHPILLVVIFWDGVSRGTKHMIDLCRSAQIQPQIIQPEGFLGRPGPRP